MQKEENNNPNKSSPNTVETNSGYTPRQSGNAGGNSSNMFYVNPPQYRSGGPAMVAGPPPPPPHPAASQPTYFIPQQPFDAASYIQYLEQMAFQQTLTINSLRNEIMDSRQNYDELSKNL
jgi:hypothetical protein